MSDPKPEAFTPDPSVDGFSFMGALAHVKDGGKVARICWNGPNQYVAMSFGGTAKEQDGRVMGDLEPFLVIFTTQGKLVPWLASQGDLTADDWQCVEAKSDASLPAVAFGDETVASEIVETVAG